MSVRSNRVVIILALLAGAFMSKDLIIILSICLFVFFIFNLVRYEYEHLDLATLVIVAMWLSWWITSSQWFINFLKFAFR